MFMLPVSQLQDLILVCVKMLRTEPFSDSLDDYVAIICSSSCSLEQRLLVFTPQISSRGENNQWCCDANNAHKILQLEMIVYHLFSKFL